MIYKSKHIEMPHGFFDRIGGFSEGDYASLNGNIYMKDPPAIVHMNRRKACDLIRKDHSGNIFDTVLIPNLTHSATPLIIDDSWNVDYPPKADAIITKTSGLPIGLISNDCVPILIEDAHAGIIAVAHAGREGLLAGILQNTINAMLSIGAKTTDIRAAIGPCIMQDDYEIDEDIRNQFLAEKYSNSDFFKQGHDSEYFKLDLPGYIARQLNELSILIVDLIGISTFSDNNFFSRRRRPMDNNRGCQISAIFKPY